MRPRPVPPLSTLHPQPHLLAAGRGSCAATAGSRLHSNYCSAVLLGCARTRETTHRVGKRIAAEQRREQQVDARTSPPGPFLARGGSLGLLGISCPHAQLGTHQLLLRQASLALTTPKALEGARTDSRGAPFFPTAPPSRTATAATARRRSRPTRRWTPTPSGPASTTPPSRSRPA